LSQPRFPITARGVQRARITESPEEARTLLDAIATGGLAENTRVETRVKTRVETRVETRVKTRVESLRGTEQKILVLLAKHPAMSAPELATAVGITLKGIEWNLAKLRREHRIRHVGPRQGGVWELRR
jgi:ATP-dependent DNA helicase RecG